jgi:hypothetical protein
MIVAGNYVCLLASRVEQLPMQCSVTAVSSNIDLKMNVGESGAFNISNNLTVKSGSDCFAKANIHFKID